MNRPIVCLVDDQTSSLKFTELVQHAGYSPLFATNEVALSRAMVMAPVLCIVDVGATTFKWEKLVRVIKGPAKKNNHVPVLGFGLHIEPSIRERALTAGCSDVVSQSAIVTDLPKLIERHIWRIDPETCAQPLPALALQGVEEFNQGRYFDCHETLEDAWNDEAGVVRLLYQGILQVAVGYLHITRKNWRGAVKVLERGIPKCAHFQPTCQGVDVAHVVEQAQAVRAKLIELGPERIAEFDPSTFPKVFVNGQIPE